MYFFSGDRQQMFNNYSPAAGGQGGNHGNQHQRQIFKPQDFTNIKNHELSFSAPKAIGSERYAGDSLWRHKSLFRHCCGLFLTLDIFQSFYKKWNYKLMRKCPLKLVFMTEWRLWTFNFNIQKSLVLLNLIQTYLNLAFKFVSWSSKNQFQLETQVH